MNEIFLVELLRIIKTSSNRGDIEASIFAVFKLVWLHNDPEEGGSEENDSGCEETDSPTPGESDYNIITCAQTIFDGKNPSVGIEPTVVFLHLARALVSLGPTPVDAQRNRLEKENPTQTTLKDSLQSRCQSPEDIGKLLLSPTFDSSADEKVSKQPTSKVSNAQIRRQLAFSLGQKLSACVGPEFFRFLISFTGGLKHSYKDEAHCCAMLGLDALGTSQPPPEDLLQQLGLTASEIINPKTLYAQTLAYIAFCDEIQDETEETEDGALPARERISSSLVNAVLDLVIASLRKRAAVPDKAKVTLAEFKILLNYKDLFNPKERESLVAAYWTYVGSTSQIWNITLLRRIRNVLERFCPRATEDDSAHQSDEQSC